MISLLQTEIYTDKKSVRSNRRKAVTALNFDN